MTRRPIYGLVGRVLVLAVWSLPTVVACAPNTSGLQRFEFSEGHMGTEVRLVLYATSESEAQEAKAAAYLAVAQVDSLLSDYSQVSDVALLGAAAVRGDTAWQPVSDVFLQVATEAEAWRRATGGAFDVSVGPMTRLWRWALRRGELPLGARLDSVRDISGPDVLELDPDQGKARLRRPGAQLDFGGIAKGYAAQQALDAAVALGIRHVLADAGGDLVLGDPPPGERGWRIQFPGGDVERLANVAVATSGDQYQFLEVDGVRYSHILDPRTGLGVVDAPTVVVVAGDGTTADVLASALTVLGPSRREALLAGLGGVAVRVIPRSGGDVWETDGFPATGGGPAEDRPRATPNE